MRPVAADFSPTAPRREHPFRVVLASGGVGLAMIILTSYALSIGGVFRAGAGVATTQEVHSLQPPRNEEQASRQPATPPAAQATEAKPAETKPAETKPAETKPAEAKPAEAKPAETEPAAINAEVSTREVAGVDGPESARAGAASSARQAAIPPGERAVRAKRSVRGENAPRRGAERTVNRRVPDGPAPAEATREEGQTETAKPVPPALAPGNTFSVEAANSALDGAAQQAKNCRPSGGPTGSGRVQVRYQPSGKVASVSILTPEFANSAAESCITMLFRRASVPAFTGAPVVVMDKGFDIP